MSGISNDLREVEAAASEGNPQAQLAIEVMVYQIAKSIGSYLATLDDADGIVFTGGIGENAAEMRQRIIDRLPGLAVALDEDRNRQTDRREAIISSEDSHLTVLVIPTREDWIIARDTYDLIQET
jgi:acetate kinase